MPTNLKEIKKGATYTFSIESFENECEDVPINISTLSFAMTAKYGDGTTAFTKNDAGFVAVTDYKRTVTLSKTDTAALTAGELYYQIDVTYPDTTSVEWMDGYINVVA